MKVCFIIGAFPPMKCGIGDYTYNLCKELNKKGIQVDVITSTKSINENKDGLNIHNIVDEWTFKSKDIILNKLKELNVDIVHIQYPSEEYGSSIFINLLPLIIRKNLKIKVVETVHEYLNYTYKGKIRNLINYKFSDVLVTVEKQYIKKIKEFMPMFSKNINIKYIPISSNIPSSNISDVNIKIIKEELELGNNKIISYFGFINELKGFEVLIESIREIKKEVKNIKLLILSELNKENDYHNTLMMKIKEYSLSDSIIITGFVDSTIDVANYLKISDLVILPFRDGVSERNGSFLAAYNQGIPIVTTSIERRRDEEGIYFVRPGDSLEIAKKSKDILEKKVLYKRNIISWDKIAEMHREIYIKL